MIRGLLAFLLVALAVCLGPLSLPSAADAQQPAPPRRIGALLLVFSPEGKEAQALRQGLRDAGYVEGRDVVIEWRSSTSGDYARVPELIADLVRSKVEVIVVDNAVVLRRQAQSRFGSGSFQSPRFVALACHFGVHWLASLCASAILSGVICSATSSRSFTAMARYSVSDAGMRAAARLAHLYAWT